MPTTHRPTPTYDFSYDAKTKVFTAEMSAIAGTLEDDHPDGLGLTLVGRTGREVRFVVSETVRDADEDVVMWTLRSLPNGVFGMTLFND